jgi:PadR family transcriptional regulator PadR
MVLSLLERKAMYGYEIIKETEALSQGVFQFKEGTLYPVLHALESSGYVESYWDQGDTGRRRKYYQITRKGEAHLKEKQKEWAVFTRAVGNVLEGALR